MRLDRFLSHQTRQGKKTVRKQISDGLVRVDGVLETFHRREIGHFTTVELDGTTLQENQAIYLALNKPAGYLSATKDPQHPTVIELINAPYAADLHIAGRLDRASTGLLLLTNDGQWSRALTEPDKKVPKVYHVTLRDPIDPSAIDIFKQGIYFAYEDMTTAAVELDILAPQRAKLTLYEGRYHQIKRMFHAIGNKVTGLHRHSIGTLSVEHIAEGKTLRLSPDLTPLSTK